MPPKKKISKSKPAARTRRRKQFEAVLASQELRDAVDRLPDLPLPGAPVEIPPDLPELNPASEQEIVPKEIFSVSAPGSVPMSRTKADRSAERRVWVAVFVTFAVIAGAWAAFLKNSLKQSDLVPSLGNDLKALRQEWDDAAENIKGVLDELNERLEPKTVAGTPEGSEVLQAAAARVIFEAARASGTATSTE